jgi:RNA polymerase sigma factor (sigma-70 family)
VNHDGFDTLVAEYHGEIHRYLLLITGRMADADDLSQETFVRAFKARGSPGHVTNARAWLFAIATGLSQRRLRSGRRQARDPIEQEDRGTMDGQGQHAMAMAITRLAADQRVALVLRKLHDFDYEEIGGMLGCSSESARRGVMRAFRKLARIRPVESALGPLMTRGPLGVPACPTTAEPTEFSRRRLQVAHGSPGTTEGGRTVWMGAK